MSILDSIRDLFDCLFGLRSDQTAGGIISTTMPTRYEGDVPYLLHWNFWVRAVLSRAPIEPFESRRNEATEIAA